MCCSLEPMARSGPRRHSARATETISEIVLRNAGWRRCRVVSGRAWQETPGRVSRPDWRLFPVALKNPPSAEPSRALRAHPPAAVGVGGATSCTRCEPRSSMRCLCRAGIARRTVDRIIGTESVHEPRLRPNPAAPVAVSRLGSIDCSRMLASLEPPRTNARIPKYRKFPDGS